MFLTNSYTFAGPSLISAIAAAGLTAPKICLDAGDAASYQSGATWLDTSGNATNFTRSTPTFNGVAGALSSSEYWTFNGTSDYFPLTAGTNPAFADSMHQDNATFTVAWALWPNTGAVNPEPILGDTTGVTGIRIQCNNSTGAIRTLVNNSGASVFSHNSSAGMTNGAWNIGAVSINEAGGATGGIDFINGTAATFNATYSSPSAGAATSNLAIGRSATGAGSFFFTSTTRLAWLAVWNVALSSANLTALYAQTRARFSL